MLVVCWQWLCEVVLFGLGGLLRVGGLAVWV